MPDSIKDKVLTSLKQASFHNSNIMVKPEVILWPDPDRQWEPVIGILQNELPGLLIFGNYNPDKNQGPAIWLKCMINRTLPEASWGKDDTPIIYLPGISRNKLKNIHEAGLELQPILEYQYTGTIWSHKNGKEWTILAFMQNSEEGLGINIVLDNTTKDALLKVFPSIFQDDSIFYPALVDSNFLHSLLFPDAIPNLLKWICQGNAYFKTLSEEKQQVFKDVCKNRFKFEPDYSDIIAIVRKLGEQNNDWKQVWQYYAAAPAKFPELENLLRESIPPDMGTGMFKLPEESWPQFNEGQEEYLRLSLLSIPEKKPGEVDKTLTDLSKTHAKRTGWVWCELGKAPLAKALECVIQLQSICKEGFPAGSINEIKDYYVDKGYLADLSMRKALASVKTVKDKEAIVAVISSIYRPWLEKLTAKFQELIKQDASIFNETPHTLEPESFILFIDAFRYELAMEFFERISGFGYKRSITPVWTVLPSQTPTAKPFTSPIALLVSRVSECNDFRPQLNSGKDTSALYFREALESQGYVYLDEIKDLSLEARYWKEIGDIDTHGHSEQSGMVKRIEELFDQIQEVIETVFSFGVKKIKIVTDHGWLLLPGGLPKENLVKDLTVTRWGRCAVIKEEVKSELIQLPWYWNQSVYVAYAPGISFFKKNEEYAHGGISLQECLVPVMTIENNIKDKVTARIETFRWVNLRCNIETTGAADTYKIDIRTKYNDSSTSVCLPPKKLITSGKCSLMADDASEGASAFVILLDENEKIIDKKLTAIGSNE